MDSIYSNEKEDDSIYRLKHKVLLQAPVFDK